jgi:hypothetical protein
MTATIEGTRLDALREKEIELAAEVDVVRNRLEGYPAAIAAEREQSWFSNQKNRPLAKLNSPLQKLIDSEKADVAMLNGLQADLAAVRNVIQQEDVRVRERETKEARAQLEQLNVREEAAWKRGGEVLVELAGVWNELVAIVEEESRVATANRLETGILAVEPVPSTFKAFLLLLHTAATDPAVHAAPHVQELTETGIFGRRDENGNALPGAYFDTRPAGTQTTIVRRKLDENDRLFHLIPALGSIVRKMQLSGRIPTIAAE